MILLSTLGRYDDSQELRRYLGSLACPLPIRPDVSFSGKWEDGEVVSVCGERKKVPDLASSINDGSLVHKFQLSREEGHRFQFLVVEGLVRRGDSGLVEVRRGQAWVPLLPEMTYRRFRSFLLQCWWYLGIQVIETTGAKRTAEELLELWMMWQSAPIEHSSLAAWNEPERLPDLGLWDQPTLVRRWAKELDGVGWKRSLAVEKQARLGPGTPVEAMLGWGRKEWEHVEGIGKKGAENIWSQIHGR